MLTLIVGISASGGWVACVPFSTEIRGHGVTKDEAIEAARQAAEQTYENALFGAKLHDVVTVDLPKLTTRVIMSR